MPKGQIAKQINKEVLYQKYVIEGKSTRQVAIELGVTKTCILRHMSLHQIARRESPTIISRRYGSTCYNTIKASYMTRIRKHALQLDVEYSITAKDIYDLFIRQNSYCALSGVLLTIGKDASLDRINSKLGYTMGNLQWVHKKLQKMKQTMDNLEFIHWCSLVGKHHLNNKEWC
jgi:hypothetical protein